MAKIRLYQIDDLEEVVQLWYRTWHQAFPNIEHPQSYSAWKTRFHDELSQKGDVWLAEVDNQTVGFVLVFPEEQWLSQLFVDQSYQRQGIGSALLAKAKEICPTGMSLHTLQANVSACAFYERHGFQFSHLSVNKINGQPNVYYRWEPESR